MSYRGRKGGCEGEMDRNVKVGESQTEISLGRKEGR